MSTKHFIHPVDCPECAGTGTMPDGDGTEHVCRPCNGDGKRDGYICNDAVLSRGDAMEQHQSFADEGLPCMVEDCPMCFSPVPNER